jgi:hypothetical protein
MPLTPDQPWNGSGAGVSMALGLSHRLHNDVAGLFGLACGHADSFEVGEAR